MNFPTNPTSGNTYTFNGRTWVWNGTGWAMKPDSITDIAGNLNIVGNVTANTFIGSSTVQATTAILTNLTANYLPKHTATGLVNSSIYDSNGNIILGGTSSNHTSTKLNVLGGLWVGDYNAPQTLSIEGNIELKMFDNTIGGIKYHNADSVNGGVTLQYRENAVSTSLQAGLTLNYKGNVGIGTTDPSNKLTLVKVLGTSNYASVAQHNLQFRMLNGLGTYQSRAFEIGLLDDGTGVIQANEYNVGYNKLLLNPAGGNVGIGTTDPTATLDVNGIGKFKDDILTSFKTTAWSYDTSKSLKLFLDKFDIDANGNLVVLGNLYSTGEVTAYSSGTGVSGLKLMGNLDANNYDIYSAKAISAGETMLGSVGAKMGLHEELTGTTIATFDDINYNYYFAEYIS